MDDPNCAFLKAIFTQQSSLSIARFDMLTGVKDPMIVRLLASLPPEPQLDANIYLKLSNKQSKTREMQRDDYVLQVSCALLFFFDWSNQSCTDQHDVNVIGHRRAEGGAAFTKREYYATNDAIV